MYGGSLIGCGAGGKGYFSQKSNVAFDNEEFVKRAILIGGYHKFPVWSKIIYFEFDK